jgi:hypothetical protein
MVQTPIPSPPRRLAEAFLLCRTKDGILVRGARRWAERALVSGFLSVDDIRNGVAEACTLLPGASLPAPLPLSQKSGAVASAERPGEAVEQLDDT